MKKNYASKHYFLVFIFSMFISLLSGQYKEGVIRIKLKETKAVLISQAKLTKSAKGYAMIGDIALDAAMQRCKATDMKRVFRPAAKFEAKHRKHGLHLWYEITFDKNVPIESALKSFQAIQDISVLEPVHEKIKIGGDPIPVDAASLNSPANDAFYDYQWHYENTGSNSGNGGGGTVDADIDLPEAWTIETGNPDVIVAVIDGGIDVSHEDLATNMWVNSGEIAGNGIDDDGNGYVDDVNGYGFGDSSGTIGASNHGTHVGGTVAAVTNNNVGVAGVAGGNGSGDGVRMMSCATFGSVTNAGFDEAFVYAADNGAVIAQNSWGYIQAGVFDQSVLDAIDYFIAEAGYDAAGNAVGPMQGGIVIFAAGNDGTDDEWYPGYYDAVMAVGSTDNNDNASSFSNRGDWVDIAAPGSTIVSTYPNNGYAYNSGTSMACPHVSGVAALIVSQYAGNITPTDVWSRLVNSTDPLSFDYLGSGRLNAFASLESVGEPIFPDPNKTYYIDNPRWDVRLGADGSQDAFTTSRNTTGDSVEWTITPSPTEGYYYIDCVGGGNAPRIRTDLSQFADMQSTNSAGTWTRWSLTDVGNGEYQLTTLKSSDYMRMRVNSTGQVETVTTGFNGNWTRFVFVEAGTNSASATARTNNRDDLISAATDTEVEDGNTKTLLYPIPAIDYLNVSVDEKTDYSKVEIVDWSGAALKVNPVMDGNNMKIDVSRLPKGVHFLRLTDSKGASKVVRFIR